MIEKIVIHVLSPSVGLKAFNFLSAWLQSKNAPTYKKTITIEHVDHIGVREPNTVYILFSNMPEELTVNTEDYDLVLFSNSDEPLTVATDVIVQHLHKPNCHLISNSFLTEDHTLYKSVIPCSHDLFLSNHYWTNPAYPQYHTHRTVASDIVGNFVFVNGENRSWRQHFMTLLIDALPDVKMLSNVSDVVNETNEAAWESQEDRVFRQQVNAQYNAIPLYTSDHQHLHDIEVGLSIDLSIEGIDSHTSMIYPGYFILPEFYQYKCVTFPETQWQNNEVALTEKLLKCAFAKSIPWPVGGSNINKLYNQLGFKTAWNLLPEEHQQWDSILDHDVRYRKQILAMKWLHSNTQVLYSSEAEQLIKHNTNSMFNHNIMSITVEKLWQTITGSKQL